MIEEDEIDHKKKRVKVISIAVITLLFALVSLFIFLEKGKKETESLNEALVLKAALTEFHLVQRFNKLFPKATFQLNTDEMNYKFMSPKVGNNYFICSLPNHKIIDREVSFEGIPDLYEIRETITDNTWSFSKEKKITEKEMLNKIGVKD